MRRSVARRIKAGLVAFTIIDAGVLFLGMARVQDAPRSIVGNAEVAMQPLALPPLFASVPGGAVKQDAAASVDGTAVPMLPVQAVAEPAVPESVTVPAALLASAQPPDKAPAQRLANRAAKRMQTAYARYHSLPGLEKGTATSFSSAFEGESDTPLPNPHYLPDPDPLAPDSEASAAAPVLPDPALDAAAAMDASPVEDVAAAPLVQDQGAPQPDLAPAAPVTPDVSAAELSALPATASATP